MANKRASLEFISTVLGAIGVAVLDKNAASAALFMLLMIVFALFRLFWNLR